MRLRNLFEAEGKTAVVAFGRLNPPTIGHQKLVNTILSKDGDPYLFLSQTQKAKTDPLDFDTKLAFTKSFFPNITVGHSEVRTPIQMLQKLQELGYSDVIYVAGSDRVEGFDKLFNQYNGVADKSGVVPYKFNSISVISAGDRDPDADGAEGMSASKMRSAALNNDFDSFKQGVPKQDLADKLFKSVQGAMGVDPVEEADDPKHEHDSFEVLTTPDEVLDELDIDEYAVKQQRPKLDVINNIAMRKDNTSFPLSYKDTGDGAAATGGQVYIDPQTAKRFIAFYDNQPQDNQQLMDKALKSVSGITGLFKNLGLELVVKSG